MSASSNMMDRQPPTNDEITEYVEQILHGADLEKITMKTVYKQVCSLYQDFDLAHKKDFIQATIMSTLKSQPTIAQMEKLVKFLEENPEIATGTDQANNADESLQTTQKWEAIAKELNLMGGENRSGGSWAEFWDVLRSQLNHIIAERKSAPGSRGEVLQPYPRAMMEQMIILLGGPGNEENPADSLSNDEIRECVEQLLHGADLEKITMKSVYEHVCSHYPEFDLAHRKDFIKATIKSTINSQPTIAQMEKLMKFLEENPEIATGTDQANNANEGLQTTQKWETIAKELNLMGGENRSGDSWAEFWDVLRNRLNHIVAERKSAPGSRGEVLQPYPRAMMERMIILLRGPGNEENPADSPSNDEIRVFVEQICTHHLENIWRKAVYKQVCSHYPEFDLAHRKDFIKAKIKSITRTYKASQQTDKMEDLNPESWDNGLPNEEEPTNRAGASIVRRAARRIRRRSARALRSGPPAAERLINIDEGRLQVNLQTAEILSNYGATAENLGAFIAACSNSIAGEIARHNTLN